MEHACQAAQLAEQDENYDEVIVAAFLHDLGHLLDEQQEKMDGYGIKDHQVIGADYLRGRGFPDRIVALVNSHVEAKRYLCAVNQRYYESLSHASKMTLNFKGGPMREDELKLFEHNLMKRLIIKMPAWDEEAKNENVPLPDLDLFRSKIITLLTRVH